MKLSMAFAGVAQIGGLQALAHSSPPTLIGLPEAPAAGTATVDFVTPLLWLAAAIAVAVVLIVVWRWFVTRRSWSAGSSAALGAMCRGLRLTASEQRTLKVLAKSHGNASAVTLLLCPSAIDHAAARAGGEVDRDAIKRLRQKLA
ncbi:MAG: hypothetical protein KF805_03665 [Phycisphaeraceae bacterium]|nr:hypothetical protein [Phycisphaeraceae bacterium]